MPKRAGNLYTKIVDFKNILQACKKAKKGKKFKKATAIFELNLEKNIIKIQEILINKSYRPSKYNDFYVTDSKKRLISAAPYFDRVIHHALMNIIEPILCKSFIFDSYACVKGKGTHAAVKRYKKFMKNNTYVLKCDIKKYFHNINHEILFNQIQNKIKCKETLWLIKTIIDSRFDQSFIQYFKNDNLFTDINQKKGIPIGNLTSQIFANVYLNDLDHYVKEQLKYKFYIRYCDDFVLFGNFKKDLFTAKIKIQKYLDKYRLQLHENKSRVYNINDGVDFLGFRIFKNYSKVRKNIVHRFRKKLKKLQTKYKKDKIEIREISQVVKSFIGHAKHANSYRLREEILSNAIFSKGNKV